MSEKNATRDATTDDEQTLAEREEQADREAFAAQAERSDAVLWAEADHERNPGVSVCFKETAAIGDVHSVLLKADGWPTLAAGTFHDTTDTVSVRSGGSTRSKVLAHETGNLTVHVATEVEG